MNREIEAAVIKYIENNQYKSKKSVISREFGISVSALNNLLKRNNIQLLKLDKKKKEKYFERKKKWQLNKMQIEATENTRHVSEKQISNYRKMINKALETKSPLIIKNIDVFIEECWDKIKEEYGYVVVEPLERIYKIFRRKK